MKIPAFVSMLALLLVTGRAETINFDSAPAGSLPAGWTSAMTHSGGAPQWAVLTDDTAPSKPHVLAQTSTDRTSGRFPLAILERANFRDGEIMVKFKPISGRVDQAAGLVWRYRDENNYYIVRANALEDNVVLYKVERGMRTSLAPKGNPVHSRERARSVCGLRLIVLLTSTTLSSFRSSCEGTLRKKVNPHKNTTKG